MWWILGIVVIGYVIYLISKDHKEEVKTNVINQGGMQQKYKVLIDHFVDNLPARVTKLTNDSVVISASAMTVYLDYVGGNLEVELRGVAPVIGNYSKRWKYPSGYPQGKMIEEIENYTGWLLERVMNKLE